MPYNNWFNVNIKYDNRFYNYTADAEADVILSAEMAAGGVRAVAAKVELETTAHLLDGGFNSRRYILRHMDNLYVSH